MTRNSQQEKKNVYNFCSMLKTPDCNNDFKQLINHHDLN